MKNRKLRTKNITILLAIIFVVGLFGVAPKAHAQAKFNDSIVNWSQATSQVDLNSASTIVGTGTGASPDLSSFCSDNLFKFQKNNLFVNTFCDLGSILAISTTDFATNVTCTIQKVAMTNYDNSIEFNTQTTLGTTGTTNGSVCLPRHNAAVTTPQLIGTAGDNIFGTGDATGGAPSATGFYAPSAMSQLSHDINPGTNVSSWIYSTFKIVRNFATVLALIFLMIFAFANILHIDINTYTIKKMIPNIIIAIVGAYLAIYAIMLLSRGIDFLYRLEFFSPYNSLHPFYNIMGGNFGSGVINSGSSTPGQNQDAMALLFQLGSQLLGGTTVYSILSGLLGIVMISIPAIISFAFDYMLALRPVAVGLLVIISPIAFAAYVFPTGQNIFKKWVSITLIALFYTPVVNLVLYIINQPLFSNTTSVMYIILLLVKSAVFVLLIRLPFTIETDIQKISLALAKTSFGGALGFGKGGQPNIKVKQDNKNTVTDQALASKEAKSLIAPINNSYRRNIAASKTETKERGQTMSQLISRNQAPYVKNLDQISDKAHKTNLARTNGLLVNSIIDLPAQALQKIVTSSNKAIFRDTPLINQLKLKNGQLLDNEGAVTRADAVKKVFRGAQLVEQGKIGNPEAVKLLSQKQMLSVLPLEIIQKALNQGIISKDDIRANFKGDPDTALQRISEFNRGKVLNTAQLQDELKKDFEDSKSGFTDLLYAIGLNRDGNIYPTSSSATGTSNITKTIETLKNQNQSAFDQNSLYYLSRLGQVNNQSQDRLATTLEKAGTPAPTAIAISHNPALNYEQISSYIPQSATPETISIIRETIAERNNSQAMIKEISSSVKDDKAILGRTIAEKMSESLKSGTSHSFDDIKNQISQSLKNLTPEANPQDVKNAISGLNSFAPGTAMQTATAPSAEELEKVKDKGEVVLSTIDEMKMSGIDEKVIMQNPQAAAEKYTSQVQKNISDVVSGKVQPAQINPAQTNVAETNIATGSPDINKVGANTDQIAQTIGSVISTKTENGKTFDQAVSDIAKPQPNVPASPDQTAAAPKPQPGTVKNG